MVRYISNRVSLIFQSEAEIQQSIKNLPNVSDHTHCASSIFALSFFSNSALNIRTQYLLFFVNYRHILTLNHFMLLHLINFLFFKRYYINNPPPLLRETISIIIFTAACK